MKVTASFSSLPRESRSVRRLSHSMKSPSVGAWNASASSPSSGMVEDIRVEDKLMIIGIFAHDTKKLAYVLDTTTCLVGVLCLERLYESGLLDNHVNDGVEVPLVGACLVNEGDEALERTACGSSTGRVERFPHARLRERECRVAAR